MLAFLLALLLPAVASDLTDAQTAYAAGNLDDARESFLKARKEEADAARAWRGLALLAAKGDAKSLAALNSAKTITLGKAALGWMAYYKATAQTAIERNFAAEADNYFHDALQEEPLQPLALLGEGMLLQAQGDLAGGLAFLVKAAQQPGCGWMAKEVWEGRRRWFDAYIVAFLGEAGGNSFLLKDLPVPYDGAWRKMMDEVLGEMARSSDPVVVQRGQKLAQKLAETVKDACTNAVATTWDAMLELRLSGNARGLELLKNAPANLSNCPASEERGPRGLLRLAEAQLWVGDPRQALENAKKAEKALESSPRGQAEAALLQGQAALLIPDVVSADAALKRASALYAQVSVPEARGKLALANARLLLLQNSAAKALLLLQGLQGEMEKVGDDPGLSDVMLAMGEAQAAANQSGSALSSFDQASAIAKDAGYSRGIAAAELEIGRLSLTLGDPTQAQSHLQQALSLYEGMKNPRGIAASLLLQAKSRPDSETAPSELQRALSLLRPGPTGLLADTLLAAAGLAGRTGHREEAEPLLVEAEQVFTALNLPDGKARILTERIRLDPIVDTLAQNGIRWPRSSTPLTTWIRLAPLYGLTLDSKAPASGLLLLAQAALSKGESTRATDALELALGLSDPSATEERLSLLIALSNAQLANGNPYRSAQLMDLAIGLSSSASLHLQRARLALYQRDAGTLQRELPLAVDPAAKQELAILHARSLALSGDLKGAVAALLELQKAARQAGDSKALARVLVEALELGGAPGAGAVNEALSLADASGDENLALRARLAWLAGSGKIDPKPAFKLVDLLDNLRNNGQRPPQLESWDSLRPRLLDVALGLFTGNQPEAAFRVLASAQFQRSLATDWLALADRRNLRNLKSHDPFPADVVTASLVDAGSRLDALDPALDDLFGAARNGKEPVEAGKVLIERRAAALRGATEAWKAMLPGEEGRLLTPTLSDLQSSLKILDSRSKTPCWLVAYHPQREGVLMEIVTSSSYNLIFRGPADLNPPAGPPATLAQRLLRSLANGESNQDEELEALHRWLIAPLALPEGAPLFIVADDGLGAVPFEALHPATSHDYLGLQHPLVMLPSTTSLLLPQRPKEGDIGDPPSVLGFGSTSPALGKRFPEASTCGYGEKPVCNQGTTLSGLNAMIKQEFDLMELRVPGWSGANPWTDAPPLAGLSLSDGNAWAHRLEHALFHTDLVVLPELQPDFSTIEALNSSNGLATALLTTRVRSVLWNRWPVDTAASRIFLESFYLSWQKQVGKTDEDPWWKAKAMQQAREAVRNAGYGRPSDWAAMALSGAPN